MYSHVESTYFLYIYKIYDFKNLQLQGIMNVVIENI